MELLRLSDRRQLEQRVRSWLSPPDPWKNHNIACKSRHRGSGAWFVQGNTFSEWKTSEARVPFMGSWKRPLTLGSLRFAETEILLLVAGAGKSVLWYVNFLLILLS
jgi:hypothetical protein